jgi:hypothetical protein
MFSKTNILPPICVKLTGFLLVTREYKKMSALLDMDSHPNAHELFASADLFIF